MYTRARKHAYTHHFICKLRMQAHWVYTESRCDIFRQFSLFLRCWVHFLGRTKSAEGMVTATEVERVHMSLTLTTNRA